MISTPEKIQALKGHPLWIDNGDRTVDGMLSCYLAVITGYEGTPDVQGDRVKQLFL